MDIEKYLLMPAALAIKLNLKEELNIKILSKLYFFKSNIRVIRTN